MMILLLGAFLVGGVLTPISAAAHAELTGTDPADGTVLESPPARITLIFNESVNPVAEGTRLFDSSGPIATLQTAKAGNTVEVALPEDLADGSYVVGWRVVSADSHPITGALGFSIGAVSDGSIAVPADDSSVMPVTGVTQAIGYLTLLAAVGILWFRVFTVGSVDRWSLGLAMVAAAISSVAHLLLIPLGTIRERGEPVGALLHPEMWKVEPLSVTLRAVIFVVAGLAIQIRYARSTAFTKRVRRAVALGGLLALGSLTVVGHTADIPPTWLMHGSDFMHGAAGAVWFGGLIGLGRYLYLTLRERATGGSTTPGDAARVVARFSWLAGLAFAALAFSGLVMSIKILGSFDALLHTTYGKLLIVKLGVVLIPFLLAGWNRLRLVPAVEREPVTGAAWNRLRATVLAEAALLVVVLSLTGFLVLQNPVVAASGSVEETAATVPFEQTGDIGDGTVGIRIAPGSTGENEISLQVRDAGGNPLELLSGPVVRWSLPEADLGPLEATANATGEPGTYTARMDVPLEGDWTVEVVTRISKYEEPITTVSLPIPHTPDADAP